MPESSTPVPGYLQRTRRNAAGQLETYYASPDVANAMYGAQGGSGGGGAVAQGGNLGNISGYDVGSIWEQTEAEIEAQNGRIDEALGQTVQQYLAEMEARGHDTESPGVKAMVEKYRQNADRAKMEYASQRRAQAKQADQAAQLQMAGLAQNQAMQQASIQAQKDLMAQQLAGQKNSQVEMMNYLKGLYGAGQNSTDYDFFNRMYPQQGGGGGGGGDDPGGYWARPSSINYQPGQSPWSVDAFYNANDPKWWRSTGGGGGGGRPQGMSGYGSPGSGFGFNAGPGTSSTPWMPGNSQQQTFGMF